MADLPRFLAAQVERFFGDAGTVLEAETLAAPVRRVRVAVHAWRGTALRDGDHVELRVSERAFRHYTACDVDPARGAFDLYIHLHDRGPGCAWARALAPGERVSVVGRAVGTRGLMRCDTHVIAGDESGLGFARSLVRSLGPACVGVIEADAPYVKAFALTASPLEVVPREGARGDAIAKWIERTQPVGTHRAGYVAGHAASVVRARGALVSRWGIRFADVATQAYWADGKAGL